MSIKHEEQKHTVKRVWNEKKNAECRKNACGTLTMFIRHVEGHVAPGQAVDANSMLGLCVFGVHLDAKHLIHQEDEGDGPRVRFHVQQE